MTTPADVADTPVLTAGGVTYRWSDVFLAARLRGKWEALVEAAAAPEAAVGDDELKRAGAAFRTERRLLAADELRAWLEAHRLTLADWNAYLRRRLADGAGAAPEPGADAVWAEGVCSGSFTRFAEELAARAAALAADSAAEPPGPPPADWLARMPARDVAGVMGISPDGVAARCAE